MLSPTIKKNSSLKLTMARGFIQQQSASTKKLSFFSEFYGWFVRAELSITYENNRLFAKLGI